VKRRLTIRDVAKKASLSVSTVSLVLNNKPDVSEQTRRRVQQVIAELGYHPRRSARGLASKASGNIGFILTEDHFSQAEPFYTKIFLGTEFEARNHNFYVLLTTVGRTLRESKEVPRFFLEQNVDGVIVAGKISTSWIEYIRDWNLPVILIDYDLPNHNVSSVVIDNRRGASAVVEHLLKRGHTKIGFIGAHTMVLPTETLKASPAIDWVGRKEFDFTCKEVAEDRDLATIAGLSYKDKDGRIKHNPEREMIQNMDTLPWVADVYRRDLQIEKYFIGYLLHPYISMYTGRGCPAQRKS